MRLDRYLSECTELSRSMAKAVLARGEVTVNGMPEKKGNRHIRKEDRVCWNGEVLEPIGLRYIMLNKPEGYECTRGGSRYPSVFNLLDIERAERLHTVGRLDVDSTGLLFVTDDGRWTHRIISPWYRCEKVYRVRLAKPLAIDAVQRFREGILLKGDDNPTLPAELEIITPSEARLSLQEGRYRQVKRMFTAVGNRVVTLHRERIGEVTLDADLLPGESRFLLPEEIASFWQLRSVR